MDWKNAIIQKKYGSYLSHKIKDFGQFKLILQIYFHRYLVFCNYYVLEYLWTILLKIRYSHPDIINFADFLEQEGGKVILKIDLMDFLKKNTKLLRI